MHYYFKKYPFLNYDYTDFDGLYTMFSVPPEMLVQAFTKRFKTMPENFFDCGAATGEIVLRATKLGMTATGIDIKKYPYQNPQLDKLFKSGKIQIKSILDCEPVKADLVYCNGTLTYFTQTQLPCVLNKFIKCKMLVSIHNTVEDVVAARKQGDELLTCNKPRLIKSRDWWIKTFADNNFFTEYDTKTHCFLSMPKTR